MKVKDLSVWQERCADLATDEVSQTFRRFLEAWADQAEHYLDWNEQERSRIAGGVDKVKVVTPAMALRHTLRLVEEEISRCDAIYMGQALAVLAMHWEHGVAMMEGLTPIERRLVEDVTLMKIRHVQQQAEQVTGG